MGTRVEKFEDLEVWQNAIELITNIYKLLKDCRDYSFKDQICRASVSIPSNIAEGFERQYNKEFIQFLYIAKGSAGEVRTQLLLALRLEFICNDDYQIQQEKVKRISAQLYQLIKPEKKNLNNINNKGETKEIDLRNLLSFFHSPFTKNNYHD